MRRLIRPILACLCCAITAVSPAQKGDYYQGPYDFFPQSFLSSNGEYKLGIDYSKETLRLVHGKKQIWQVQWMQGAAPEQAFVADDGSRVVLIDTIPESSGMGLGRDGNGKKLVVFDEKGSVLNAYRADDLFLGDNIMMEDLSQFSIQASINCPPKAFLSDNVSKEFVFLVNAVRAGGDEDFSAAQVVPVSLDLMTGKQVKSNPGLVEKLKKIQINGGSAPPDGLILSELDKACYRARLGDTTVIPALKQFLDDKAVTGGSYDRGKYFAVHDNQTRAAQALAEIMGKDAVPLIEPKLVGAAPADRSVLLDAIGRTGVVPSDKVIAEIERNGSPYDQLQLLQLLEKIDKKAAVRQARNLVHSRTDFLRREAQMCICQNPESLDEPYLKGLLRGTDPSAGLLGLTNLNPPDIGRILKQEASKGNWAAEAELADRGDRRAQLRLVSWVNSLGNPNQDKTFGDARPEYLYRVAPILGMTKPLGAKAALEKAKKLLDGRDDFSMDLRVRGALAQLGDQSELQFIRTVASGDEVPSLDHHAAMSDMRRSDAIDWLGEIKDRDSVDLLQDLSVDTHYGIRQSARRALGKMGITPNTEPHLAILTTQRVVAPQPAASSQNSSPLRKSNSSAAPIAALAIGAFIVVGGLYFSRRRK